MQPIETDRTIIRRVQEGDTDAFAELVRLHQDHVFGLCLAMLKQREEAEDAAEETFLKAYRSLRSFRGDARFSTWLYRIAYRQCLDRLKSRMRKPVEPLDESRHDRALQEPAPDQRLEIEQSLSALPPDYRAVIQLREMEGQSYAEIANTLSCSVESVRARLRRARLALIERTRHDPPPTVVQTSGEHP